MFKPEGERDRGGRESFDIFHMLLRTQTQQLLGTSRSVVKKKKKKCGDGREVSAGVEKKNKRGWRVNEEGLREEEVVEGSSRKNPLINPTTFKTETII